MLGRCLMAGLLGAALLQAQTPDSNPLRPLADEYWRAHEAGQSELAAAKRAELVKLVTLLQPDPLHYVEWTDRIPGLALRLPGMRGVLEDVLAHAGNKPGRGVLLTSLSGSFDGEGNPLKAVECQEKALAAAESSPAEVAAFVAAGFTDPGYEHLAKLYDRLGRRNDAKAVLARFEARAAEYSGGLERARERNKTALPQLTPPRRDDPVEMKQIYDVLWQAGRALDKQVSPPHDPVPGVAAGLALEAVDRALRSSMWDAGFASQVLGVANRLAWSNALAQSDRIYERVLPVVQKWSVDDPHPLLQVLQFRAAALESTDRAQSAIDDWRAAVISAHGKDSNAAVEVSRDQARLYERRKDWPNAIAEVQQNLADQARLTGTICLEYSSALNLAVEIYEAAGRGGEALSFRHQQVGIADRLLDPQSIGRALVRIDTATALARQKQFEEADLLVDEAVSIARSGGNSPDAFHSQLAEIQRLKAAAKY